MSWTELTVFSSVLHVFFYIPEYFKNNIMKTITILGSTGTIGENTLNVIAGFSIKFNVFALTANKSRELYRQVLDWRPRYAVLSCTNSAKILSDKLKSHSAIKNRGNRCPESLQFVAAHEETDYMLWPQSSVARVFFRL